ncbi:phospholipase effector Tle1 domain-containing protein [Chryseobacterium sp. TY3]
MSIEYFVEGKVITQTEGDNISLSKEDISHNSTQLVNQQGTDTGVSYNSPKEIHTNDKPVNTIDVSLNLFFDGTQNNKTNTQTGKDHKKSNHKDDSYTNDFSNVARGFDTTNPNAENQIRVYIEGIGTDDLKSDDVFPDVALGTGDLGVVAKVTKGCIEGAKAVGSKFKGVPKEINLTVNVFGFSRGATAARHFIYVATSPAEFFSSGSGFFALTPYDAPSLKNAVYMKEKSPLADTYGFWWLLWLRLLWRIDWDFRIGVVIRTVHVYIFRGVFLVFVVFHRYVKLQLFYVGFTLHRFFHQRFVQHKFRNGDTVLLHPDLLRGNRFVFSIMSTSFCIIFPKRES